MSSHAFPILCALGIFSSCAGGGDTPPVVELPDEAPAESVPCETHSQCGDSEVCGGAMLCESAWGDYEISFESIEIPELDANRDADGSPPDPRCDFRLSDGGSGTPEGGTDIATDTFKGSLTGGGYPTLGPGTVVTFRCFETDGDASELIGEYCFGSLGDCGPIPLEVMREKSAEFTLVGGAMDDVVVRVSLDRIER